MKLTCFRPPEPLAKHVQVIWTVDGVNPNRRERVLPNGAVELIINLGSWHKVVDETDPNRCAVYKASWIAGIQERPLAIEPCRETRLLGIRFRPGGARSILRLPLSEVTNRVVECDLAFDGWTVELRERILQAGSAGEWVPIIERFLCQRIRERADRAVNFAVKQIQQSRGTCSIDRLAGNLGISHKHLITRFRDLVGTTPKMLARVERFQHALALAQEPIVDWAGVAVRCGYYDQAHMIRDFRQLAGVTPEQYLRSRDPDPNHLIVA